MDRFLYHLEIQAKYNLAQQKTIISKHILKTNISTHQKHAHPTLEPGLEEKNKEDNEHKHTCHQVSVSLHLAAANVCVIERGCGMPSSHKKSMTSKALAFPNSPTFLPGHKTSLPILIIVLWSPQTRVTRSQPTCPCVTKKLP